MKIVGTQICCSTCAIEILMFLVCRNTLNSRSVISWTESHSFLKSFYSHRSSDELCLSIFFFFTHYVMQEIFFLCADQSKLMLVIILDCHFHYVLFTNYFFLSFKGSRYHTVNEFWSLSQEEVKGSWERVITIFSVRSLCFFVSILSCCFCIFSFPGRTSSYR